MDLHTARFQHRSRSGRNGSGTVRTLLTAGMALIIAVSTVGGARVLAAGHSAKGAASCKTRQKASGTVRFSDWIFPDTLNGFQTNTSVSATIINAFQDSLVAYDNNAKLFAQIATTIPTLKNGGIKNGGKTIIVNLKKGLKWSSGKEITSADVKFGWQVGMNKATGPFCSGSCDAISRIDVSSKYQAILHLKQIYAPAIPNAISFPLFPTSWPGAWNKDSNAAAQKLGQDSSFNFETTKYPTNGAYQVSQFTRDDRVLLTPMKYYHTLNCGAAVKNLIFAFYSSKEGMIGAAAAKQTDVTDDYLLVDLPALRQHTDAYRLSALPSFAFDHFELNADPTYNGKPNPLSDTKVRQALALSLDRYGLLESTLGLTAKTAKSVVAWTPLVNTPTLVQPFADKTITGQWDPIQKKYVIPGTPKAVADAKKLLSQTSYASGFSLDFIFASGNPTRQAQATVAQRNWGALNVSVNLVPTQPTKLLASWEQQGTLVHGLFQVAVFGQLGGPDPDGLKYDMQSKYISRRTTDHAAIDANDAGINDSQIDKAFDAAAKTFDGKLRQKYYSIVQQRVNQQAYWIPLEFRPAIATADSHVGSFFNNPTSAGVTWNVFNWKTKTG